MPLHFFAEMLKPYARRLLAEMPLAAAAAAEDR